MLINLVYPLNFYSKNTFLLKGAKITSIATLEPLPVKQGDLGFPCTTQRQGFRSSFHLNLLYCFSVQIITGIFKGCLDKAEDNGMTSISFPAIGTGNMGFSKNNIASSLLKEISAFSSRRQPKHLKKVVVILYPKDSNTIQVRNHTAQQHFSNTLGYSAPPSHCDSLNRLLLMNFKICFLVAQWPQVPHNVKVGYIFLAENSLSSTTFLI